MLKAPSDAQLSIVGLEVELGSGRTHRSRYLLVEIVDVLLELSLALGGGQGNSAMLMALDEAFGVAAADIVAWADKLI